MIQTELQLGNYVYLINRNHEVHLPIEIPQRISKIGLFEIEVGGLKISDKEPITVSTADISPIPLTEDILIRCGFERHKVNMSAADMWQGMDGWSLGDSGWLFRGNLKSGGLRLVGYFNTKIFYLHQLQNLVKLLCNQTIELK